MRTIRAIAKEDGKLVYFKYEAEDNAPVINYSNLK